MVQYSQINMVYHISNKDKKSQDHLNKHRKAFDKIQHPFMTKTLIKVGIKVISHIYGYISKYNKGHYGSKHHTLW